LKEKLLAALRSGIKHVLIPLENKKDLAEVPDVVKKGLKITCVKEIDEVLKEALIRPLIPIPWVENDEGQVIPSPLAVAKKNRSKAVLAH